MKSWVARVMQISYMNIDDIERLQAHERRIGYVLPNPAIQELLHLGTVKDALNIPMDVELQRMHAERVEKSVKDAKMLPRQDETEEGNVGWMHALDMNVHKNFRNVIFEYTGPAGRRKKGRLYDAISGGENKDG